MLLVTGITGHSGSYFLKELIKNNYIGEIRCVVRENSDTSLIDNSNLNISKVFGDLNDEKFMNDAMSGIDTVLHIASIFYSTTLVKTALNNNVNRVILVHTTGIYSKYKSASSEYKNIESNINSLIAREGLKINLIYLRPTMIFGNLNDKNMIVFIKMVDRLRIFPIVDKGNGLLQPVNGRDLGKAYYQVLNQDKILNGDYILSGEKPISMLEVFKIISTILNKKTIFISLPLGLGVFMARCLKIISFGKIDFIEKVQRMAENRNFSHDKANKDFEYSPMSFEEGLKLEIDEYLNNK